MIKLDLSKMKHIKSDDRTTTLQHPAGHMITLAHKALTPEGKAQVKALAEGGRACYFDGGQTTSKVPVPGNNGTSAPPPYDKTANAKSSQTGDTRSLGDAFSKASSNWWDPEKKAEGGVIKHEERPSQDIPAQKPVGSTLDYKQLRKEYTEKNRSTHVMPKKRKMYADPQDVVSANDATPDIGGVGKAADHYREAARLAEKAGDVAQGSAAPPSLALKPGMPGASDAPQQQEAPKSQPHAHKHAAANKAKPASDELSLDQADDNEPSEEPDISGKDTVPATSDTVSDQGDETLDTDEEAPQNGEQAPVEQPANDASAVSSSANTPGQPPAQQSQAASDPNAQQAPKMDWSAHRDDVRDKLIQEEQAWQADQNNGHITPKTYNDLFAKKDTLGKISSLFGLLVSGMGSGLSHQPNAVMAMMDKQIQNDLEAQKASKTNAYNLHNLNQQRLVQESQVALNKAQGKLTESQAATIRKDIDIKGNTLDQIIARRNALHSLATEVDKLPEGKEKEQKRAVLTLLTQQTNSENFNLIDQAAQQSATLHFGNTPSQEPDQKEKDFQSQVQSLRNSGNTVRADYLATHHIPGMSGQTSEAITQPALDKLRAHELLDSKVKDVLNFAKQHANVKDQVNPAIIKEGKAKAQELTSFYNQTVDNLGMTKGRLDWLEEQIKTNPQSLVQQLLGNNATLNEIMNSNKQREQLFLKGPGGLGYTESGEKTPAESKLDPKNQALNDWAKKHPQDPRSKMVLKKLGIGQ